MAHLTPAQLQAIAEQIRIETVEDANDAIRIGNAFKQILNYLLEVTPDVTIELIASTISDEVASRNQAINTAINNLKTDLLGGASSAYDTFKELQTLLENDAQLTSTLVTGLANEITARQNAITNEETARVNADNTLTHSIEDEAFERADADSTLATQIANETTARNAAINTAVNNLKNDLLGGASSAFDTFKELEILLLNDAQLTTTLITGLANEVINRQNAINELQQQIANLGGGIDAETLLKINQAYNFAQQSCLTDDNGEIFTEDNGDVIIDL